METNESIPRRKRRPRAPRGPRPPVFDVDGRPVLYAVDGHTLLCAECVARRGASTGCPVARATDEIGRCDGCGSRDRTVPAPACGTVARLVVACMQDGAELSGLAPRRLALLDDEQLVPRGFVLELGGGTYRCVVERLA